MPAGSSPASGSPRTSERHARVHVEVRLDAATRRAALAEDVRRGLTARPRRLPPKYFYDATGSALFDRITRLPEYYLTRAERAILGVVGPALMRTLRPEDVVEIGAGTATKIRPLLRAAGTVQRYVPVDVDETTMTTAATLLVRAFPNLRVHGLVGDFERDLRHVPPSRGRRLVVFFGSTLGNLEPPARRRFLRNARRLLRSDGRLLLGLDLMKDPRVLHAAYDDAAGVTAAFNRNVLRVINHELAADFDPDAFRHEARVDEAAGRVEMHLVAERRHTVSVGALDLTLPFAAGDGIWTESSYKFTRPGIDAMLADAGLELERWLTDPEGRFAMVVAGPAA
jgi:L-histidine N-alpha-methyltransferase